MHIDMPQSYVAIQLSTQMVEIHELVISVRLMAFCVVFVL